MGLGIRLGVQFGICNDIAVVVRTSDILDDAGNQIKDDNNNPILEDHA